MLIIDHLGIDVRQPEAVFTKTHEQQTEQSAPLDHHKNEWWTRQESSYYVLKMLDMFYRWPYNSL